MKRIGVIISLAILIVLLSSSACFATGLKLVDSYPTDGKGGLQPAGVAIKLYFNEDVSANDIQKENKACMKLVDSKKKEIPLKVLHAPSKPKELLVIVDKTLKEDASYTFTLSSEFQASSGDTLDEDAVIHFKTLNVKQNTNISMIFMIIMVVGMVFFSSKSMKKQMEEEEKKKREEKVNPYKVAKETGKAVEEIVAAEQKKREKEKEKTQKYSTGNSAGHKNNGQNAKANRPDLKRVSVPRPISAAGSTYKTGRKAAAEKKAREEAARKKSTNPKNATGKSKNTKNKKKK